jgi:hypothetical protein
MFTIERLGRARGPVLLALCLLAIPAVTHAQSVAGVVRDTSGAVLPGVTVEASSPALIERTRSVVTDGNGQYQIIDLRPGAYSVTFSLPGFATIARPDVEVTGGGVTTVNAELRVSAVQETITVTGVTPVVDVQTSTSREIVLSNETVQALPSSRGYGNYLAAIPGISGTGLSASATPANPLFTSRGGRSSEGNMQIDGMNVGSSVGGGGVSGYYYDLNNASEVQVTIAGGLAEVDRGGPAINVVPKSGGNNFSGTYFTSYAGEWAQSSNIDDALRAVNLNDPPALIKNWDASGTFLGPVMRDRVWFFANVRTAGTHQDVPNRFANLNAGDPSNWRYQADPTIRMRNANSKLLGATRLTWQASQRHKLGLYIDYTKNCTGSSVSAEGGQCRAPGDDWTAAGPPIGPGVITGSQESGTILDARSKINQATYTAPLSNTILVEAGFSSFWTEWGDIRPVGAAVDQIAVTEQSTAAGVPISNWVYHGWPAQGGTIQQNANYKASLSYVTGSHNFKVGYQGAYMIAKTPTFVGQQISYRFNSPCVLNAGAVAPCVPDVNGRIVLTPNQLTQRIGSALSSNRVVPDAFYVQDQWTRGRLTLQGGLRYEHVRSFFPEGENGYEAHRFGEAFHFERRDGVTGYNDITPRMGGAFDVFGNGKTAVKVSMSKYLQAAYSGEAYTVANPAVSLVQSTTRGWTDADGDFVADCDFLNSAANGECLEWANLQWRQQGVTTTVNPATQEGWGVRNWDWQFSAGVQQEIAPRVSVDVNYSRRWWGNFFVTHNAALTARDWDEVSLVAPVDDRLPNGGGYTVSYLTRNTTFNPFGATSSYYTSTSDFGDETRYWHGVDVSFNARFADGLVVQGGTSTGRGVTDTCEVEIGRFGRVQRVVDGQPACSSNEPWLTSLRGLATYTLPKVDVLVSAIFRSSPNATAGGDVATNGTSRAANYLMTAAQFRTATGQTLVGATTSTVNLLLDGQLYGDRVNNLDMRFAKIVRFKGTRANVGIDLYNILNANTPTTYESTYAVNNVNNRWNNPTAVVNPRFMRFSVQFDF